MYLLILAADRVKSILYPASRRDIGGISVKKLLSLLMALSLALSLTACGGNAQPDSTEPEDAPSTVEEPGQVSEPEPVPEPEPEPAPDPEPQSPTVYVTKSGKRYHYSSSCNGGTYYESTLEQAQKRHLTPCEKCVG